MICGGSGVGVKALRPRSGARMRGLDADPTSAKLRESGECHSLQFTADHSAHKQPFGHFRKNEQPSEQPPTKMISHIGEVTLLISLLESWCREGGGVLQPVIDLT